MFNKLLSHTGLGLLVFGWIILTSDETQSKECTTESLANSSLTSEPNCLGEAGNVGAPDSHIPSSLSSLLPRTLLDWRECDVYPARKVWDPLEAWFATRGLRLFMSDYPHYYGAVHATNNTMRAPDGNYVYSDNLQRIYFQVVDLFS